uniref:Uncharacterized protein n=1 Tax=Rhipicephalus zambeziensis TaxID=60191 RepID=A0A224YG17_9ACAR
MHCRCRFQRHLLRYWAVCRFTSLMNGAINAIFSSEIALALILYPNARCILNISISCVMDYFLVARCKHSKKPLQHSLPCMNLSMVLLKPRYNELGCNKISVITKLMKNSLVMDTVL